MTSHELDRLLERKRELTPTTDPGANFRARLTELRRWQAERLARSYADLRREPRYSLAVDFFLSELYGPRDVAARDRQMLRAWRYFRRTLPASLLRALGRALELEILSSELDLAMAGALPAMPLDERRYAQAYRAVGRRASRERQIELVIAVGEDLDRVVRHAWLAPLLKAAHAPAHAAGFGALQDFIERGYRAFRAMEGAGEFLETIRERETALMQALFAGGQT